MKYRAFVAALAVPVCTFAFAGTALADTTNSNVITEIAPLSQTQQAYNDVESGNITPAVPASSPATSSNTSTTFTTASTTLTRVYGPFTYSDITTSSVQAYTSPHFNITQPNIKIMGYAHNYTGYNSGNYSYTLFKDTFFGSTDEGSRSFPYGQTSNETAYGYWSSLPSGSYNFVITTPSYIWISGGGTVWEY